MSVSLVTDDEKNAVKQALKGAGLAEQAVASFDNTALECLHRGGYRTADRVKTAQRPGLERCNLLPADADSLLTHLAGATAASVASGAGPRSTLVERFEELCGGKLSILQAAALLQSQDSIALLAKGEMSAHMAKQQLSVLKSGVAATTRMAISNNQGYYFDGLLGTGGQAGSSLYAVFKEDKWFCGKAYLKQGPDAVDAAGLELFVSEAVHNTWRCPTLIKVRNHVESLRHRILILPLYPKSVADLIKLTKPGSIPKEAAACVAAGVLAAVAGLFLAGFNHNDIKPGNIMLAANQDGAVLIDLGSCTRVGEELKEWTEMLDLGLPKTASLHRDLTCLASTLVLACSAIALGTSEEVAQGLEAVDLPLGCQLAKIILKRSQQLQCTEEAQLHTIWQEVTERIRAQLGEDFSARLDKWWPQGLQPQGPQL